MESTWNAGMHLVNKGSPCRLLGARMYSPRSGFRVGGARARYALAASSPGPPPATADASWSRCVAEDDSGRPRLDDQETTHQDNAAADEQQERQRSWSSTARAFQLGAPAAT